MQLQATTDYAIRMLLYLATKSRVVNAAELSNQLKISHQYVYNIGRKLKNRGYVDTINGTLGGYVLIRDPARISLYDILLAFESTIKINRCLEGDSFCSWNATKNCVVHEFYVDLQNTIKDKFKEQTLSILLSKHCLDEKKGSSCK